MDYVLPAAIFLNIAIESIALSELGYAFAILGMDIVLMIISFLIASMLKLPPKKKGVFILSATFGASSMLGYPVIQNIFPNNHKAMADAIILSEIGVGLSIFTIGVGIAMHYGSSYEKGAIGKSFLNFLKSPVFIALVLGLLVSASGLKNSSKVAETLRDTLGIIAQSLELFVAITIGLILKRFSLKNLYIIFIIIVILKLVLKPLFSFFMFQMMGADTLSDEIIIIETAMPTATLAVVFSSRYGLDENMAVNIMLGTLVIGIILIPLLYWLLI